MKFVYNKSIMKLVNGKQMKSIDERAIHDCQIPSLKLMENAGIRMYQEFIQLCTKDQKIIVVCGSGNNGGDGFVLARLLAGSGYHVAVNFVGAKHSVSDDCKVNFDVYQSLHYPFTKEFDADVIVDAIFGTGLSRSVEGNDLAVIAAVNASSAMVISIDIPSGIHATSGHCLGAAIQADYTFTLQVGKIGLYLYPGRSYSGKVIRLDIGIPQVCIDAIPSNINLIDKYEMGSLLPKREIHSNKGTYGKVLCVGGSEEMSGAISLAALSALRSGCGLVTCAVPNCIREVVACNVLESMHIPLFDEDGHISFAGVSQLAQRLSPFTCILIGCGIGRSEAIQELLSMLLESDKPLIIDADALYALKPLLVKKDYRGRKNIILTPHLKEFAYLVDKDIQDVIAYPIEAAMSFSETYPHMTLVLKSETTILVENGEIYLNVYGNNGLAKGGSGDVLAGMITGLYAQSEKTWDAARLGVFLHARAADMLLSQQTVYSIIPSDLFKKVDDVIKSLEVIV